MADRLTVIGDLTGLANEAAQRGDDRAAASLRDAVRMMLEDSAKALALEKRRASDADRQEKRRLKEKGITLGNVTSRESRDSLKVSPHPFLNPEDNDDNSARSDYAEAVETLQGLVHSRVGETLWRDVDGFLRRRDYSTWGAWMKEMLAILTGGTAVPDDLAQVCRDDGALDRKLGSPKGLRTFVATSARDRMEVSRSPPSGPARRGSVSRRDTNRVPAGVPAPPSNPDVPTKWQT